MKQLCMGPLAILPLWGVLMGHCAGETAVYGPSGYFSFMGCANGRLRVKQLYMGPLAIFHSWGVLMGHCAGETAVYGPSGYLSFMGCANGPLCG
jgi:hypothetical protein